MRPFGFARFSGTTKVPQRASIPFTTHGSIASAGPRPWPEQATAATHTIATMAIRIAPKKHRPMAKPCHLGNKLPRHLRLARNPSVAPGSLAS